MYLKGCSETAQMKNIHLVDNIIKLPVNVNLDKVFVSQVFQNLLSNAIKFSQTNNNIRVVTSLQRQKFVFEIIDEGIPIGQHELDLMFNKLQNFKRSIGPCREPFGFRPFHSKINDPGNGRRTALPQRR